MWVSTARERADMYRELERRGHTCGYSGVPVAAAPATTSAPQAGTEQAPPSPPKSTVVSGSAFVVSTLGHLVTNAHVTEGCQEVELQGKTGSLPARVVARDSINDLAVLRAEGRLPAPIAVRSEPRLRAGESVVVLGFPLAGLLTPDVQVATGSVSALAGLNGDTGKIQISAPIQVGSSGGPVLDGSGNVVGVAVSKLDAIAVASITGDIPQNVNFAVASRALEAFLDANEVAYLRRASDRRLEPADIAANAKEAVLRVTCRREVRQ